MAKMNSEIINKQTIHYTIDADNFKCLPTLYTESKLGKTLWWSIKTNDNCIYSEKGQVGGKTTAYAPTECFGKNIGRKNETTDEQQALFEAFSKWNKKCSAGYHPQECEGDSDDESNEDTITYMDHVKNELRDILKDIKEKKDAKKCDKSFVRCLPMLANKFVDAKKVTYPVYVSEKLDGIRCLSAINENNTDDHVEMWSRTAKDIYNFSKIRESLQCIFDEFNGNSGSNLILDGELYSHNIPFNELSGIIRRKTKKSPKEDLVEYHIFDIVDTAMGYEDRLTILRKIKEFIDEHELDNILIVDSKLVNTKEDVYDFHNKSVDKGYEGCMIRSIKGTYCLKSRSKDLLKLKMFDDKEFEVIGIEKGKGTEEGCVIFVCKYDDERTFTVRPRGTMEKRRWQYKHKKNYIGKMLTVRLQSNKNINFEEDDAPRFGVGICFDDKTMSLEPVDFRDYE